MRVVLDTNVWIAGLIARGTCTELIEHCLSEHEISISDWILSEIARVLGDRFSYSTERIQEVRDWLRDVGRPFDLAGDPPKACRDPDDDHILLTAIQSRADCIVTGDRDLLDLEHHAGIPILAPADFWRLEHSLGTSDEET